ncbi:DUF4097 family beta strand repeat-containing protein [Fulvivirgaceae bacterium BMA10]|uniref:DUF4097 family beta strand repeat-containing protein n=1 Tax=Splendidivirga corallicola TaxID=3051826 RepID=A0ABT8KIB0_9BACT|nr:DUF4097 family beta strand repeat-containing protein [Fulvivirgaceae bacterium BMA10]
MDKKLQSLLLTTLFMVVPFLMEAKEFVYKLDEIYTIKLGGKISLSSRDADIKIVGSDRKDVRVKIYRKVVIRGFYNTNEDKFKVDVFEEGGDLYIKEVSRKWTGGVMVYTEKEYTILVEAPNNVNLKLDGDDDDYIIKNIEGSIKLDNNDGDVVLENCTGKDFDLKLDDGNVEISDAKGFFSLYLNDGNFTAENCSFDELDVRADDGDIYIETFIAENGGYNLKTDDGDIRIRVLGGGGEFEVQHDDASIRTSSVFKTSYDSEHRSKFTLAGGNSKIYLRTDDGRIDLIASR